MTPAALETLIRNRFNALNDTFFSSSEIESYIWSAELELATELDLIEDSSTDTTVADQRNYNFPTNAYKIKAVNVDDESLKRISLKVGQDAEIWDDASSGTPDAFYEWNEVIYLDPPPDTAGQDIDIYYYELPTDPSVSGTLDLPAELHQRLANKVLADMYGKDQNSSMAAYYTKMWEGVDKPAIRSWKQRKKRGDRFQSVRITNE